MENISCSCGSSDKVILSCSGAANVGAVTDGIARMYSIAGVRGMKCLANLAAFPEEMKKAWDGKDILVLDGCEKTCGHVLLDNAELPHRVEYITQHGCKKGQTIVNTELLKRIYDELLQLETIEV